jgi:RNA polymerase sigma-70 factor (ECF subfamily)
MESHNRYDGVDPYVVLKIRYQAKLLTRSRAFSTSDIEDIKQELMFDLVRRLPSFNPARAGKNTFISRVVENHAASMIESAMAGKRGYGIPHQSLLAVARDGSDSHC